MGDSNQFNPNYSKLCNRGLKYNGTRFRTIGKAKDKNSPCG